MALTDETKKEIADLVTGVVDSALQPLQKQVTDWSGKIRSPNAHQQEFGEDGEKGMAIARAVRAIAATRGNKQQALEFAKATKMGDRVIGSFQKSLLAGDFSSAGFIVPPDVSRELIDLLRPASVMRQAGVPIYPMPRGTLNLPKKLTGTTTSYIGEAQDIPKSDITGGHIVLSAKKLAGLVPISNDLLLTDADPLRADDIVRADLVESIGTKEDMTLLRGIGTQYSPKGLRYQINSANVLTMTGSPTYLTVDYDFTRMINALEQNNVRITRGAWFMAPRTKNYLASLRDGNGNIVYEGIRSPNPTLWGFPVFVSSNIPINLSTNQSEVYLANMPDLILAETGTMEIMVSDTASYIDSGSTYASAFSRDETVVRILMHHDFSMRYDVSACVLTAVTWGA